MEIRPIHTDADCKAALCEVSAYFDNEPEPGTPDGDRFDVLLTLVDFIVQNLPIILDAALKIVTALTEGLAAAAPTLMPGIITLIGEILRVLFENIPVLFTAGAQLIAGIAQGLANAVPQTAKDAIENFLLQMGLAIAVGVPALGPKIDSAFRSAVSGAMAGIKRAGKNIVEGLWAGIMDAWEWLYEKIQEFMAGIIDAVLEAEEGHSPARKFMPAGRFAALGFEAGMNDEFKAVNQRLLNTFGSLADSPAFSSVGSSAGVVNNDNSIANPVYINGLQIPGAGPSTTINEIMEFLNRRG
jgi:phage-related protein